MSGLSDGSIIEQVKKHNLVISPFDPECTQASSYDVHLGGELLIRKQKRDLCEGTRLYPGEFALGHTLEWLGLPHNIRARIEGKSTVARHGMVIHLTAGFIDPGFEGQITLELKNLGDEPYWLQAGDPIGQFTFEWLDHHVKRPYGEGGRNHYQFQRGTTPAWH